MKSIRNKKITKNQNDQLDDESYDEESDGASYTEKNKGYFKKFDILLDHDLTVKNNELYLEIAENKVSFLSDYF